MTFIQTSSILTKQFLPFSVQMTDWQLEEEKNQWSFQFFVWHNGICVRIAADIDVLNHLFIARQCAMYLHRNGANRTRILWEQTELGKKRRKSRVSASVNILLVSICFSFALVSIDSSSIELINKNYAIVRNSEWLFIPSIQSCDVIAFCCTNLLICSERIYLFHFVGVIFVFSLRIESFSK